MFVKVLLGGGAREFTPVSTLDAQGRPGLRTDNRSLIEEWLVQRKRDGDSEFVQDKVNIYKRICMYNRTCDALLTLKLHPIIIICAHECN